MARRKDRDQGIYRRLMVRMWGDEKVMALSRPPPCGQVLWVHLLAGEQTDIIPGLCRTGEAAFAEQLGWGLEGFREAFAEVSRLGMAKADWRARVVWVPKAIEHNAPASPNVVVSWSDAWDRIPECALKLEAWSVVRAFLEGMSKAFVEAFDQACPKPSLMPFGNQEQDQEQDQEQEEAAAARPPLAEQHPAAGSPETGKEGPEAPPAPPPAPAAPVEARRVPAAVPLEDEAGGGPPVEDSPVDAFRTKLAHRLARFTPHPVGGGASILACVRDALDVIPEAEAVELCARTVVDMVAAGKRQPATLAFFAKTVLADEASRRRMSARAPKSRRAVGVNEQGEPVFAEDA